MIENIRKNARSRLNENLQYLNYISSIEPSDPRDTTPLEVNIMKGLFYVHLYSSLEKIINELVAHTITLINSKSIPIKHFNHSFLTIALNSKLQAFKMCNNKNYFTKSYEIFFEINKNNKFTLQETVFAESLQNVWFNTIKDITQCFGIELPRVDPRVSTTINELVDKRNAVAHGRENAATVGSSFRTNILRDKLTEITTFIYNIIDLYEDYLNNKKYLKSNVKKFYI